MCYINTIFILLQKEDCFAEHNTEARTKMAANAEQLGGLHEQELQESQGEVSER